MAFRIRGLDPAPFQSLYGLDADSLRVRNVLRRQVKGPGFPERVELRDMELGDTALLLNYEHLPVDSPYRSRHAIYVREGATQAAEFIDTVPTMLAKRLLSVRAFDAAGMMRAADVLEGHALEPLIARLLADPDTAYLHAHTARQGCYLACIDRV